MSRDDDRVRRARRRDSRRRQVLQLDPAAAGNRREEGVCVRLEAERLELAGDPALGREPAARAGSAVGIRAEALDRGLGLREAERRRQLRAFERRGMSDRERGDQERKSDDEPRPAIEPCVDRPLERAAAAPPAPGG
jgi:hypothetical protein